MKQIIYLLVSLLIGQNLSAQDMTALFKKVDASVVIIKVIEDISLGEGDPYQKTSMQMYVNIWLQPTMTFLSTRMNLRIILNCISF